MTSKRAIERRLDDVVGDLERAELRRAWRDALTPDKVDE